MKSIRKADSRARYVFGVIEKSLKLLLLFAGTPSSVPSLSKCQSPPPVTAQMRRAVTPDNPDPAEVITEVNRKKNTVKLKFVRKGLNPRNRARLLKKRYENTTKKTAFFFFF